MMRPLTTQQHGRILSGSSWRTANRVVSLYRDGMRRAFVKQQPFVPSGHIRWFSNRLQPRRPNGSNGGAGAPVPWYLWMAVAGTGTVIVSVVWSGWDVVPVTGRHRWIVTSPQWEQEMGDSTYQSLLQEYHSDILPPTHRASITVQRVGARIAQASREWILDQQQQQQSSSSSKHGNKNHQYDLQLNRPYTYTVVRSDTANAFVLPGNHVFVMTGLFRYVHNEDELAAVLSHEAAHNVARHAGERVSSQVVTVLLRQVAWWLDPSGILAVWMVPAVSTLVRELPHSRQQEQEADAIGLHLTARACFDPRAAPVVFRHMADQDHPSLDGNDDASSSSSWEPPEFLSTHPSHPHRIAQLEHDLPQALEIWNRENGRPCRQMRQAMEQARQVAARQANQREKQQQQQQQRIAP